MPQHKDIQWAQLRVGITVVVAIVVFTISVFTISGQIGFATRKYTLRAYFPTAAGLRPGSQVNLAGIPAGTIKSVKLAPNGDPKRAVEIVLQISKEYQPDIRADSKVDQTTAGLLGDTYLEITRGTLGQPAIPAGGEIKGIQEADIKSMEENVNEVVSSVKTLTATLNDMLNQINAGKGTIGKMLYDETFYNKLTATVDSMQATLTEIQKGNGTIGKLMSDPTAYNKMLATIDRLNDFMDQVQNGKGTMGRLMSDPALYNQLRDVTTKANAMLDDVNKGKGTLGKLVTDDELYNRVNSTVGHLNAVTERMEKGTGTLGKLSTDDTLYKNLAASSESMKEFLAEFRKNPKKYLSIKLHIF